MYNEIKLMIEKIFTTEQYIFNMKYKTPDIVDYFIRKSLNCDIGKNTNSIINKYNNTYIIININSIEKEPMKDKVICLRNFIYKGYNSFIVSIPESIRHSEDSEFICESTCKITKCILSELKLSDYYVDIFSSIISMNILMDIFNERDYIRKYFTKHIKDEKLLDRIFNYIAETDNPTHMLIDEFELVKLVDDMSAIL